MNLDTRDPGKAADVAGRAAILFARVSGYIAENTIRMRCGCGVAYDSNAFEAAIDECFPELTPPAKEPDPTVTAVPPRTRPVLPTEEDG